MTHQRINESSEHQEILNDCFEFDENESLIGSLTESRLFRTESMIKMLNARDIADCLFLYCITLTIFKNTYETSGFTYHYVKKTQLFSNFDIFRTNYNDLCALIYVLSKKENFEKYSKTLNDKLLINKVQLNMKEMQQWLRDIYRGVDTPTRDRRFLLSLQNNLHIDNSIYRTLRRLATEWRVIDFEAQRLTITRLLQVYRRKFRRSELLPVLEGISEIYNLEIKDAENPEVTTKRKTEIMKKHLNIIGYGVAAGVIYGFWKSIKKQLDKINDIPIRKTNIYEDASAGATSSCGVATVAQPFTGDIEVAPSEGILEPKKRKKKTQPPLIIKRT